MHRSTRALARPQCSSRATRALLFARLALIALACIALLPLAIARAQAARDTPVRIALVDSLSLTQARAEVVRTGSSRQPDVVLLRASDATMQDLGGALAMLRRMRRDPVAPGRNVRATLTGSAFNGELPESRRLALERALAAVRAAPMADIAPLGRGRWLDFQSTKLER